MIKESCHIVTHWRPFNPSVPKGLSCFIPLMEISFLSLPTEKKTNINVLKTVFPCRGRDLETAAVNGKKTMKRFFSSNEEALPGSRLTLDGS